MILLGCLNRSIEVRLHPRGEHSKAAKSAISDTSDPEHNQRRIVVLPGQEPVNRDATRNRGGIINIPVD